MNHDITAIVGKVLLLRRILCCFDSREAAKNAKRSKTNLAFFASSRLRVNQQVQP